ncbi:MAG: hypothetical protein RIG26_04330 [Thalassospira sp.]|uniref:hypothetical protein n=1 Tax=Thalassospira sp. TaxID=1912094 RepID=UPI0032EBC1F2
MIGQGEIYSAAIRFKVEFEPAASSYASETTLPPKATVGTLYCRYTVRVTDNVSNSGYVRSYIVSCRQRLILNNPTNPSTNLPLSLQSGGLGMIANPNVTYAYASLSGITPTASQTTTTGYYCYPVWAMSSVLLEVKSGSTISDAWLLNYQPRTLNSTVNLSSSSGVAASGGKAQTHSNSVQKTSGSSNTTTQSYDVSLSLGQFGGLSGSTERGTSSSFDHSRSHASGADHTSQIGHSLQSADNTSMAIKDWGVYSSLDVLPTSSQIPSCAWFLSQEYPYNFLSANASENQSNQSPTFPYSLGLSNAEISNIFPSDFNETDLSYSISPPTELAILGGDFVMTSSWQIDTVPQNSAPVITPTHVVDAIFASHYTASTNSPGSVEVVGQVNPNQATVFTGPELDLSVLALDPIRSSLGSNGAITGFLPSKFLEPIASGVFSRSVSSDNNLMVLTQGFEIPASSSVVNNTVLTASVSASDFSAQINICFKLAPFDGDLNLYLKHWVGVVEQACELSVWFNPPGIEPTTAGAPSAHPDLVFTVNTTEGSGADNNLLILNLRNTYYDSIGYHDYLVPGLNVIVIGVSAASGTTNCDYSLRTVAIGG